MIHKTHCIGGVAFLAAIWSTHLALAQAQMAQFTLPDFELCAGLCAADTPLKLTPTADGTSFNLTHHAHPNPFGTRLNHVLNFGWNLSPGGGVETPNESALGWSFESFFQPNATEAWMEAHLFFVTAANVQFRPISWVFNRNTNIMWGAINADRFDFNNTATGVPLLSLRASVMELSQYSQVQLLADFNNAAFISQL